MGMRIHAFTKRAVVLTALALLATACGGGGSGGPPTPPPGGVTVADLEGGWAGPTGVAALGGGALTGGGLGGINVVPNGPVTGPGTTATATGTGTMSGVSGTVRVSSPDWGTYHFSGSGRTGMLMFTRNPGTQRRYVSYVDDQGTVGAWQEEPAALAPVYADADVQDSNWSGTETGLNAEFEPVTPILFTGGIDAAGNFATNDGTSTDLTPIAIVDGNLGHYEGDFIRSTPVPNTGVVQFLLTPDRQFMAGFNALGPPYDFPLQCTLSTWRRN